MKPRQHEIGRLPVALFRVAGVAQRLEILDAVSSTPGDGDDMVHCYRR